MLLPKVGIEVGSYAHFKNYCYINYVNYQTFSVFFKLTFTFLSHT